MSVKIHPTIAAWQDAGRELGMLTFRAPDELNKRWFFDLPPQFTPLALDEADLLCLDTSTGELLVLDHDLRDRVLCKAAKSQEAFLEATELLVAYFQRCGQDDDYSDNEAEGVATRQACATRAGGPDYESFFCGLVGW